MSEPKAMSWRWAVVSSSEENGNNSLPYKSELDFNLIDKE